MEKPDHLPSPFSDNDYANSRHYNLYYARIKVALRCTVYLPCGITKTRVRVRARARARARARVRVSKLTPVQTDPIFIRKVCTA